MILILKRHDMILIFSYRSVILYVQRCDEELFLLSRSIEVPSGENTC